MDYLEPSYDPNHPYAVDSVTSGGSTVYRASYDVDGNMTSRNGSPIIWTVDDVQGCTSAAGGRMPGAATITDDRGAVIQKMSFDTFGQRRDPNNWDYDLSQNTISTLSSIPTLFEQNQLVGRFALDTHRDGFGK